MSVRTVTILRPICLLLLISLGFGGASPASAENQVDIRLRDIEIGAITALWGSDITIAEGQLTIRTHLKRPGRTTMHAIMHRLCFMEADNDGYLEGIDRVVVTARDGKTGQQFIGGSQACQEVYRLITTRYGSNRVADFLKARITPYPGSPTD